MLQPRIPYASAHKSVGLTPRPIPFRLSNDTLNLKNNLLLVDTKVGSHCTPDDAVLLAMYKSLISGTNEYNDFIHRTIGRDQG